MTAQCLLFSHERSRSPAVPHMSQTDASAQFTLWKKLSIAVLNEGLDGLNLNGIPK